MGGVSDGRFKFTEEKTLEFFGTLSLDLPTVKDEWREVEIPLADFIPTAFGRRVQGMGLVDFTQIKGLGFMLSDKKPGTFQMQVERVKVVRTGDQAAALGCGSADAPPPLVITEMCVIVRPFLLPFGPYPR